MNHRFLHHLRRPTLGLTALAACDDTAVDEGFQGALLATYPFEVSNPGGARMQDEPVELPEGLRVALFWQVSGLRGMPEVVEHPTTGLGNCDPLGGVCLPGTPQRVILPGDTALIPLCVEDDSPEALALSCPGPNTRPPPPR